MDLMMDLETFGNTSDSMIIQIGACYFDRDTGDIYDKFRQSINPMTSGFKMTPYTIMWWLKRSNKLSEILKDYREVTDVINSFNVFASQATAIWCHATFDWPIMWNHFKELGISTNLHYRMVRDLRTIIDIVGYGKRMDFETWWLNQFSSTGVHHDALDDCIFQVGYLVEGLRIIKRSDQSSYI